MNAAKYTHRTACRKCGFYMLAPFEWRCRCKEPEPYDAWAELQPNRSPDKTNG